ncbi:MAG: DUF302 domain-containing protein [Acidobacteria bacterium]|nr:DUF302 domain-containing protein [Acidobacteriota bacterium]
MEADGSVENAAAFPTAPWTAPEAPTHSSHRPGYEQLESKALNCPRKRVNSTLQQEGFGILTEIDVQATLKKKLDVEFRPYMILGACNPAFAYQALQAEEMIGTMLPCNVIVQDKGSDGIEVAAVDPMASMQAVDNQELAGIAAEVQAKLRTVIETL